MQLSVTPGNTPRSDHYSIGNPRWTIKNLKRSNSRVKQKEELLILHEVTVLNLTFVSVIKAV